MSPACSTDSCVHGSEEMLESSSANDDHPLPEEPTNLDVRLDAVDGSDYPDHMKNDAETQIRAKLMEIASRLADLPITRHQAVLMDVLSTFKSLMH